MKKWRNGVWVFGVIVFVVFLMGTNKAMAANARFDVNKMGDMSDFDPNNPAVTGGDTIKIATPYYWYKNFSYYGPSTRIPAEKALPFMDKELDRCKGKSPAGQ